jgi:kinesin family protein 15
MQGNEYETGLIQRTFDYLFQRTRNQPVSYEFKITYCEIYNETVYDLMNPYNTSSITIREDISRGMVYVDGLLEEYVSSADEAIGVFLRGEQNRHVGETSMNRESSRSHSIFTLSIVSKVHNDEIVDVRESRLNLVDLAGSERQKSSQTAGVRLKEAGNINKSLLALGNVINALVDISNGKQRHVQYRDSKLTFLLRDSLGGNAKTAIIGNVNPNHSCVSETISTLRFCARAKEIKTQAVVNVTYEGNVLELQEEIRRLRHELIRYKSVQNANGHLTSQEMPQEQKDLNWVYELYQLNKDEIELNCVNKLLLSRLVESHSEVKTLAEEIKEMEKVIESQKNLIQTERMKLKFKESTIDRMKASSRSTATSLDSGELHAKVAELEALNAQLEYINENHPKVNSFAAENMKLRNMLSAIDYKFTQYEAMKKMSVEANKYESLLLQLLENAKAALPKETVQVSSKADKNLISFLDVTLQDVKRELSYYQNICVDYEDMIQTKFHPEIGDLEAKLVYYKFKEMNSSRKINQMTATLQLSQQDNADLLSDLEDLNNEIIQLQASVKEKDNEISALKHEIEQIYRTHEAEMDSVKKQSHEIQNAVLAAHSQISSLEEQKKQFCDRISELEQTKMALEISVRSKEYELKEAKEDIGSLKQDLSSFKESQEHFASSHQQNIQEKEEQVKSLMVEMEDKSAILDSQAKSIESLDETNKSLTQENAQLKKVTALLSLRP